VLHNIEYQLVGNGDEPIHRVVKNFALVQVNSVKNAAKKTNSTDVARLIKEVRGVRSLHLNYYGAPLVLRGRVFRFKEQRL
jgi:hypothetical protein